jgi:hypothetical protein
VFQIFLFFFLFCSVCGTRVNCWQTRTSNNVAAKTEHTERRSMVYAVFTQ